MSQIFYPNAVETSSEFPDQEINWRKTPNTNSGYLLDGRWGTVKDLSHIANPATGDIRNKTWFLICTDFQIADLPEQISGIQLELRAQRNGRIVDEISQLTYQGNPLGNNNFVYLTDSEGHLKITNETIYGSPTDLWGADITPAMLVDPSFGVILKFQSHPYYPHKCGMFLDAVSLTVY
jgi:hypothetical protein